MFTYILLSAIIFLVLFKVLQTYVFLPYNEACPENCLSGVISFVFAVIFMLGCCMIHANSLCNNTPTLQGASRRLNNKICDSIEKELRKENLSIITEIYNHNHLYPIMLSNKYSHIFTKAQAASKRLNPNETLIDLAKYYYENRDWIVPSGNDIISGICNRINEVYKDVSSKDKAESIKGILQ